MMESHDTIQVRLERLIQNNTRNQLVSLVDPFKTEWPGKLNSTKVTKPELSAFYLVMTENIPIPKVVLDTVNCKMNAILCDFLVKPRQNVETAESAKDQASTGQPGNQAEIAIPESPLTELEDDSNNGEITLVNIYVTDTRQMQVKSQSFNSHVFLVHDAESGEWRAKTEDILNVVRKFKSDDAGGHINLIAMQPHNDEFFAHEFMQGTLQDGVPYSTTPYLVLMKKKLSIQINDLNSDLQDASFNSDDSILSLGGPKREHSPERTGDDNQDQAPKAKKKPRILTDDDKTIIDWLKVKLGERPGYNIYKANQNKLLKNPEVVVQWAFITTFVETYFGSLDCPKSNKKVAKYHLYAALGVAETTVNQAEKAHRLVAKFRDDAEVQKELALEIDKPCGSVKLQAYLAAK
ncbi:hypothetical protein C8J56DRAFT_1164658 [Mycena floridula]|nr:hypothetical protein C8J56DRAFT_1164658 [Mycena floridula]